MLRSLLLVLLLAATAANAQVIVPTDARNPLGGAKTRYLASHATDPVRWYSWSPATLAMAKKANRPVFLSIGYASCHWCHVMHRESFRNGEIAELLNAYFTPILIDREEHPELDATYLAFVEQMTGTAGWPANLILTPDLEPVVGGTYLEPDALNRLLVVMSNRWASERADVIAEAKKIVAGAVATPAIATSDLDAAARSAMASLALTPKFPRPMAISFLLRYAQRTKNEAARTVAMTTLREMAASSLHDQLGGGFHRYTTDAAGRVPHFEKMLPDQALLAIAYLEAWQLTGDEQYASVTRGALDYALRDLRLREVGGFWSSQDSDSLVPLGGAELIEGAFYFWTHAEVLKILGEDEGKLAARYWGIVEANPQNLPYVADARLALENPERIAAARAKLLEMRLKRPAPFRDDKVLAGWNGLMISALARAGAALDEPRYLEAATIAARFVTTKLWNAPKKTLSRRWANGEAAIDALPEDYALLIQGLLDLNEATLDAQWLTLAKVLQKRQDELFWREPESRYAGGAIVPEALRGRTADRDSGVPSANSVSAMNLQRLGDHARATKLANAGSLNELPMLAVALERSLAKAKSITIIGNPRFNDTLALLRVAHRQFLPNRTIAFKNEKRAAVAIVCEGTVCLLPVSDAKELEKVLVVSY